MLKSSVAFLVSALVVSAPQTTVAPKPSGTISGKIVAAGATIGPEGGDFDADLALARYAVS